MDGPNPPIPQRPEFDAKPRGSWLTIVLVACVGVALAIVLTFLTLGFFGPFLILGLAIFVVIGLQYIVWGWLFERIYRSPPEDTTKGEREA
jgi:fatty acid desaturase